MKDLIEALQIFMKYCGDVKYPTVCEREELFVNCVTPEQVSEEDLKRLDKLGFSLMKILPLFHTGLAITKNNNH